MAILKRRLLFWLIKAYIKKLGKRIILFFSFGLLVFFILLLVVRYFNPKIPVGNKESIGIVGAYTLNSLPTSIMSDLSKGLTLISQDGTVKPGVSKQWKIENNGKRYIFTLQKNIKYSDGTPFDSNSINYNFSDAKVTKPDKYTIIFDLKESFSPFLTTISRPIFKKGYAGLGNFKIKDINLNGNFVESLNLSDIKDQTIIKSYHFYPTQDALKMAFLLGEISKAKGLLDTTYKRFNFNSFPNVFIEKKINYEVLATVFYNTRDPNLSDKKIRSALSYAVPDEFSSGKRSFNPYPASVWAYAEQYTRGQDITHAKLLLSSSNNASASASINLQIKTFARYEKTAKIVSKEWEKLGVKSKIEVVNEVPSNFQVFVGDFHVPKDPDQYMLWHSSQDSNITNLENKRIDKLLEDGRKTTDFNARKKIYEDFQKYLLDDSPATFLYFPYEYEITRK